MPVASGGRARPSRAAPWCRRASTCPRHRWQPWARPSTSEVSSCASGSISPAQAALHARQPACPGVSSRAPRRLPRHLPGRVLRQPAAVQQVRQGSQRAEPRRAAHACHIRAQTRDMRMSLSARRGSGGPGADAAPARAAGRARSSLCWPASSSTAPATSRCTQRWSGGLTRVTGRCWASPWSPATA
jgi:hypothetical protein